MAVLHHQTPAAAVFSNVALYRKYRPRTFEEVVGQEAVVSALRSGLENDTLHHALLLSGTRGTGKTTLARILAKGLNCDQGPTADPCLECESCQAIEANTSPDVFELDAASHRGVDDARAIRDRLALTPVGGKRSIFILDEAHMLTREAQNALLKSLEEPPAGVLFIFCTTAPHKLLDTIRSRCHHYGLQRATPAQLNEAIGRVCEQEGIEIEPQALTLLVGAADGSFRDALALLDQLRLSAGESGSITAEVVERLLGRPSDELLAQLVQAVAEEDGRQLLELLGVLAGGGYELEACVTALAQYLRLVVYACELGEVPESLVTSPQLAKAAGAAAQKLGVERTLRLLDAVDRALQQAARGMPLDFALELALLSGAHNLTPQPAPTVTSWAEPQRQDDLTTEKHQSQDSSQPAASLSRDGPLTAEDLAGSFSLLRLALRGRQPRLYLALRNVRARAGGDGLVLLCLNPLSDTLREELEALLRQLGFRGRILVRKLERHDEPAAAAAQPSQPAAPRTQERRTVAATQAASSRQDQPAGSPDQDDADDDLELIQMLQQAGLTRAPENP